VRLRLVDYSGRELAQRNLDLVAGLFGLEQLGTSLTPVISWCLIDATPPEKPETPSLVEILALLRHAGPKQS